MISTSFDNISPALVKSVVVASVLFVTVLGSSRYFGMFQWIIALDLLGLFAMTVFLGWHRKCKSWKLNFGLALIAFTYGSLVFVTYFWSERVFMEKAINLASMIEKGCFENGECVRSLPEWNIYNNETGSLGMSTKWQFLFHETSVFYRIQPDKKNFYLQEIYQHGRMTTISVNDGHYTISHQGAFVGRMSQKGTGRITFESI